MSNLFNFKFKIPKARQALGVVLKDPTIYLMLIAIIVLIGIIIYANKSKLNTKIMMHISMAVALGTILKMFRIMKMPMGGSVTLGCMIPIIFIAYMYGAKIGCLAGVLFGGLDLILGPYVVHPLQLIIDYILAFGLLGVAGYFKNSIVLGTIISIGLRFLCHVISGIIFFSSYSGDQNTIIYSITYNATYLIPEMIITMVILKIIPLKRIKKEIVTMNV